MIIHQKQRGWCEDEGVGGLEGQPIEAFVCSLRIRKCLK